MRIPLFFSLLALSCVFVESEDDDKITTGILTRHKITSEIIKKTTEWKLKTINSLLSELTKVDGWCKDLEGVKLQECTENSIYVIKNYLTTIFKVYRTAEEVERTLPEIIKKIC